MACDAGTHHRDDPCDILRKMFSVHPPRNGKHQEQALDRGARVRRDSARATFGRLDAAYNNAGVQNVLAESANATREVSAA